MSARCQLGGAEQHHDVQPVARQPHVVVRPEKISAPSLMSDMAEVLHEVLPVSSGQLQHQTGGGGGTPAADREKVMWASFQHGCDLARPALLPQLRPVVGDRPPLVMILSLAKGFQVWALLGSGECVQLLSDRQGPVKNAFLLPGPAAAWRDANDEPLAANHDPFSSDRPLLAVVDGAPALAGRPCCTLAFVSLRRSTQVHSVRLPSTIMDVQANECAIVVSLRDSLVLFWPHDLQVRCAIAAAVPCDVDGGSAFSLADRWIFFADVKLSCEAQSSGGVCSAPEASTSYAGHVLAAAKNIGKTVSAIGETVVTSLARPSGHSANFTGSAETPVVTLIDLTNLQNSNTNNSYLCIIESTSKGRVKLNQTPQLEHAKPILDQYQPAVLTHFPCLLNDSHVSQICAAPSDAAVVAVAGSSGLSVNVFRVFTHRGGTCFAAVHHLYSLVRGSTPAKIRTLSFSPDARWLTACTNHGTAHVFALTPYGGPVSMRTHGGARLVNKESRFEQSAGLQDAVAARHRQASGSSLSEATPPRGSPLSKDTHPSAWPLATTSTQSSHNCRLPPYPSPVVCYAAARVQQQLLSASTLGARAVDMVSPGGGGAAEHASQVSPNSSVRRKRTSSLMSQTGHHMEAAFAAPVAALSLVRPSIGQPGGAAKQGDNLFLLNNQGQLTEYSMAVLPSGQSKFLPETPIGLTVQPMAQWIMHRTKSSPDVRAPLAADSPLCLASTASAGCASQQLAPLADAAATRGKGGDRKTRVGIKSDVSNDASAQAQKYWVPQVEIGTYAGPHRRLWMGPQFTFHTYGGGSQRHSPTHVVAAGGIRSEPILMPGRTLPVVIDSSTAALPEKTHPGVTMEVCGSWSDNDYISCDEQEVRLRECIAEAMRDPGAAAAAGATPLVLSMDSEPQIERPLEPVNAASRAAKGGKCRSVEPRLAKEQPKNVEMGSAFAKMTLSQSQPKGKGKQKAKGKARAKHSSAADSDGAASDASPMEDARSKFSDSSDSVHFPAGID